MRDLVHVHMPIGTFRILRSLEILKYLQYMLAGGWVFTSGHIKQRWPTS